MKEFVSIQKEDVRVLIFDKAPNGDYREMFVSLTVGNESMTITRYEFVNLLELMNTAKEVGR